MDADYPNTGVNLACRFTAEILEGLTLPEGMAVVSTTDAADLQTHLEAIGVAVVLLRPDKYIAAHARSQEELKALLEQWPAHFGAA